ncbi:MAG: SCO family protein [Bacteroidetes bacterium]|nr:MAG: SCO family protein [Bacteroidota bacterium]
MKRKHFLLSLGIILAPILIFYILNTGKQNYMQLPIFGERIEPDGVTVKDTIYYQVPDFKVTNQRGETITQANVNQGIYLVNFFFASCKDVCPSMNRRLQQVYNEMEDLAEKNRNVAKDKGVKYSETPVSVISFTVDPENDTVPVLAAYANRMGIKGNNWHFATTDKENMFKIGRGFLLPVSIEDKTIDHSQQILLIDKQNRIRGMYDALDDAEMKRLKGEVKVLLYEYSEFK